MNPFETGTRLGGVDEELLALFIEVLASELAHPERTKLREPGCNRPVSPLVGFLLGQLLGDLDELVDRPTAVFGNLHTGGVSEVLVVVEDVGAVVRVDRHCVLLAGHREDVHERLEEDALLEAGILLDQVVERLEDALLGLLTTVLAVGDDAEPRSIRQGVGGCQDEQLLADVWLGINELDGDL